MNNATVPFLNLRAQHDPIRAELNDAINEVIDTSAFAGGVFVERFEEEFAEYCGSSAAVGVGSGTEALWLALMASGVGPGHEVITVPSTFMATAEAISYCGATPVFVDVDEQTQTMDPRQIERAITPRTRAIIPVHLYGHPADMDPIMEIATRHGLFVIEDACQAHGAEYKGRRAGSIGHAGCFSFYPGKNLGAMGEAGAVVTNNRALADEMAMLRDHGQATKYYHDRIGWNARMDGVQAAVLRVKLKSLDRANAQRRAHAETYGELLAGLGGIITPHTAEGAVPVYHLYVIRVRARDAVRLELSRRGIQSGVHYPIPIHRQKAYAHLGLGRGSFPVAERCADEVLSLPMFPDLTRAQIELVAYELSDAIQRARELVTT